MGPFGAPALSDAPGIAVPTDPRAPGGERAWVAASLSSS